MKKLTKKQLEKVISNIHETVPYSPETKSCAAFGILLDKDMNIQFEQIDSGLDIYEMLDVENEALVNQINEYDMITIATCGWAAPTNKENDEYSDLAPSQHPERRRVRLFSSANTNNQVGSSLMFSDDIHNPVYDYGDAVGSMAQAIINLMQVAKLKGM